MIQLSCFNCCYNALQFDTVGSAVGFCVEHRKVLRFAHELTCGRHLRKDLDIVSALRQRILHQRDFSTQSVTLIRARESANEQYVRSNGADLRLVCDDPVGEIVTAYGLLGSKVESLARLQSIPGYRAEAAKLSLGRAYVQRCNEHNPGTWTSGIHLLMWTRRRLKDDPQIDSNEIRVELPISLKRQIEIAKWSLLMLRLMFISDVGYHARDAAGDGSDVKKLKSLAEDAAIQTEKVNYNTLMRWIKKEALPRFDKALPYDSYRELSLDLHKET